MAVIIAGPAALVAVDGRDRESTELWTVVDTVVSVGFHQWQCPVTLVAC